MKKFFSKLTLIIAIVTIALTFGACSFIGNTPSSNLPSVDLQSVTIASKPESERQKLEKEDAIEMVYRSVVSIKIDGAAGTGVIIDIDSTGEKENEFFILTCHHVISSGGDIQIAIPDQNYSYDNEDYMFTGKIGAEIYQNQAVTLVGGDSKSDIAVLKLDISGSNITPANITEAKLMDSDKYSLRLGQDVFAIGNPTGLLPGTVSVGTIAYLLRDINVESVGAMKVLQINVDTYHGSSGGGLFNMYGELIGVTNAGSDDYSGLNYAIPLCNSENSEEDTGIRKIVSELIASYESVENNYGYVAGRWKLGVSISESSSMWSGSYVYITSLTETGDLKLAGAQVNDKINSITFNGQKYVISSVSVFETVVNEMLKTLKIGNSYSFNLTRGSTTLDITTTISQYIFCDTGVYS